MNIKLSKHALEQGRKRKISERDVYNIVDNYDHILTYDECLKVYQKVMKLENKQYLYRVFVNVCKKPALVVTVYKTSKVAKYEN